MKTLGGKLGLFGLPPVLTALALQVTGCGDPPGGGDPDGGGAPFIAIQGDFDCYRSWKELDGGMGAVDGLNVLNELRTIYINRIPPAGSKEFPIGTMIVKDTTTAQTFAMVKRGGGFNPDVDGWEWFELITADATPASSCAPLINWRGTAPPPGTVYGNVTTTCNQCHEQAGTPADPNDYVEGSSLLLSHF